MKMREVFRLFACCIMVKGVRRALICDLQREGLFFVSIPFYELLTTFVDSTLDEIILANADIFSKQEIIDFYGLLISRDLGFWTSTPELFPEMDLSWENPSIITNAIIDQNEGFDHDFDHIFNTLDEVGCRDVQIRCYNSLSVNKMNEIMELLEGRRIKSIEIFSKFHSGINLDSIVALTEKYLRIKSIIIHSAPKTVVHVYKGSHEVHMGNVIVTEQIIDSNQCCGIINPRYFNVSLPVFTEGKENNSCLNRKLGIDTDGTIKNCPSLKRTYGNIYDTDIVSLVYGESFQEVWQINKDKIEVCKVCEFRYVCTDCRAFLNDDLSLEKPLKCNYDPYTLEWKN